MKNEILKSFRWATVAKQLQILCFVALLGAFTTETQAQGNLVSNGGFDTDAAGWTTNNLGLGAGYRSSKGNPGGFFVLDSSPLLVADPTISQIITGLAIGNTYIISGNYQYNIDRGGGSPTDASLGVAIDGVYLFTTAKPSLIDLPKWLNFSFFYTATSTSAALSLSAQMNNTGVAYGIDNISMSPVPEPSTCMLLMGGSATWFFFHRAQRQPKRLA